MDFDRYDRIRPIRWMGDHLALLDQRKLPFVVEDVACADSDAVAAAIRDLVVRGAPAIGISAAWGAVLAGKGVQAANGAEVTRRMDDARIRHAGKRLRHLRHTADAEHQVAPAPTHDLAVRRARDDLGTDAFAGTVERLDGDHLLAVVDPLGERLGGPAQVVVVLLATGEEGLQVDEVFQPSTGLEVVDKGEGAGRVAQGCQVLEEGYLHGRTIDQHALVPAEGRLALDEAERRLTAIALRELVGGDGQGQVRGPEANPDVVVYEPHNSP